MKDISCAVITEHVREMCVEANCFLGDEVICALRGAAEAEAKPLARELITQLVENAEIAKTHTLPVCQDTGMAVFFVDIGQDVHITDGLLEDAVNEGVRQGYEQGYLRKSVVADPIHRVNTGDNTPAIIHYNLAAGDNLKISFMPKGFGSENMSRLFMLSPLQDIEEAKKRIVKTVLAAGANACPPMVVGVCIGGDFEQSALMSKRALLRPLGSSSINRDAASLEAELLRLINETGVGPQGFGGTTTALAVHVILKPTHIAGLPVAVNICCHSARHSERIL